MFRITPSAFDLDHRFRSLLPWSRSLKWAPQLLPMLAVLPAAEAAFYSREGNVVLPELASAVIFEELQIRFGFLGGS